MNSAGDSPDLRQIHSGGAIGGLIVNAIVRFGARPAIADGRVRWTYQEFGDVVARFIALFRSLGLKKGDAMSILSSNRAEAWAAICAALVMGVRYTPLHPMAAEDDHVFIIEDAEIDVLIVEGAKFAARPRNPGTRPGPQASVLVWSDGRCTRCAPGARWRDTRAIGG
jgi:fatty-acyl-CoA synthase